MEGSDIHEANQSSCMNKILYVPALMDWFHLLGKIFLGPLDISPVCLLFINVLSSKEKWMLKYKLLFIVIFIPVFHYHEQAQPRRQSPTNSEAQTL